MTLSEDHYITRNDITKSQIGADCTPEIDITSRAFLPEKLRAIDKLSGLRKTS